MKKLTCLLLAILLIFCCGCSSSAPEENPLLTEYLSNIESFDTPVREYGKNASYIDMDDHLVVGILYPETEIETLDKSILEWIEETVDLYREEVQSVENRTDAAELTVAYEGSLIDGRYVSIKMSGTYLAPYMAHPIDIIKTFNADITTGKLLKLKDVLSKGKLKEIKKAVIRKAGVEDSDVDKNILDNWFMTKDGLEITLNRGEYLPMSDGTKNIFFTSDEIKTEIEDKQETTTEKVEETTKSEETTSTESNLPKNDDDFTIDPDKPMIALTFDDGPSAHTERLLDIFKKHGGKGTFFVVGNLIKGKENILKRIHREGHEIGNHSWSHRQFTNLDKKELTDQIMMTRAKILDVIGEDCLIVRPPYGACNDEVRAIGKELGISFVNWSVDTLDWKTKNAKSVYNETIKNADNGAIVLYHDLHKTTVDAMEKVIPKLIEEGYQLVTVTQLLTYYGNNIEPGKMYYKQSKSTK